MIVGILAIGTGLAGLVSAFRYKNRFTLGVTIACLLIGAASMIAASASQAKVEAKHGAATRADAGPGGESGGNDVVGTEPLAPLMPAAPISADPEEDDGLLEDLEEASEAANRAAGPLHPEPPTDPGAQGS